MYVRAATDAGDPNRENEDWAAARQDLIVVLDGATARTETGCRHGVSWYASTLGSRIAQLADDRQLTLTAVLRQAIHDVRGLHNDCDLRHPGTPSAAVAIVRQNGPDLEYLILGDVSVVTNWRSGQVSVVIDDRVDAVARTARHEADRHPIGSAAKQAAILTMKYEELAARNRPGGFWVAAADPLAADEALIGGFPLVDVVDLAVLTDGAARIVDLYAQLDWRAALDVLNAAGPTELIRQVREIERADSMGLTWPRNKACDDATVVHSRI